jgi:flagellar biosynthesis protein FlhF
MKLKSYYSDTVEAAVRLASVELGADAVFLGSRKNESQSGGRYEVTFAVLDRKADSYGGDAAAPSRPPAKRAAASRSVREIRQSAPEEQVERPLGQQDGSTSRESDLGSLEAAETLELTAGLANDGVEEQSVTRQEPAAAAVAMAQRDGGPKAGAAVPNHGGDKRRPDTLVALSGGESSASRTVPAATPARVPLFGFAAASLPSEETASSPAGTQARAGAPGLWVTPETSPPDELRDSVARLSRDVEQLRSWLQNQFRSEQAVLLPSGELLTHPVLAEVYFYLLGNDVDAALAAQLVSALRPAVEQGADRERVRELLALRLQALFRTANGLGETGRGPRVAAVVGPAGAGKTTALAKLAIRFGVAERRRVHLLTVDPLRVGAVEQLQAYAGLLEMPLTPVSDLALLPRLLSQLSQGAERPDLVLIDTPGYGPAEIEQANRLADCLSQVRDLDVHLVLSLTAKPRDLRRGVEQYRAFRPAKLLFARLDETDSYGPMLNESVRERLPLSFLSTGQRVPDDLAPATEARLIDLMLNKSMAGHLS